MISMSIPLLEIVSDMMKLDIDNIINMGYPSYEDVVPSMCLSEDALGVKGDCASSEHFVCFAVPEKEVEAVAEALQFVFYSALNVRRLS
ncbi:hypothetical protein RJT34_26138 [Clitoria ternatea]|uniref:Uncharacterized protein n=1 Tax=Clitoria ternatea TaxID=43366 RepID=A0AAN9IBD7_CLITE